MKTFSKLTLALLILSCTFSCTEKHAALTPTERNSILQHYSSPKDSLKQRAAAFLLAHIAAHYSTENSILEILEERYANEKWRRAYTNPYDAFFSALKAIPEADSLGELERVNDDSLVSANAIIDNIDQTFKVWKDKSVDFDTFCEYILPYRVMDEPLEYDRNRIRKKYASIMQEKDGGMREALDVIIENTPVGYHKLADEEFPYLMSIDLSRKVGVGNCIQQAVSEVMVARAVGIPATVDYVPQWGNYHGKHYMTKLVDGTKEGTFDLSLSETKFVIPKDSLPSWMADVQYERTIPKVYRMTWSVQPERLLLNSGGRTDETGLFRNLYEKDVTDEYTECSTYSMPVGDSVNVAYLCVFGKNEWTPVCAAPADGDSVVFEKVGRGIVYLPTVYKSGGMQAIGAPFYFSETGECITLDGKGGQKQRARLYSKYPMFSYTAAHAYGMKGGRMQGAHQPDFSDAKTLFTIDYYPFYRQEVGVESDEAFRYFRYLPPAGVVYNLAELQFYTQAEDGRQEQIKGVYFEGYKADHLSYAYLGDDDPDTYVVGPLVKDSWIGYDVGENRNAQLAEIVFAPRNDGNCMVPGYMYELFVWQDNGWQSLGIKQAKADFLEYSNLPQEALFRLKCHTRGVEERIFTLENGVQVWW